MRSYEAARTYFSILEFVSWCIIILGGIVAIAAMAAIGQASRSYGGSPMAGLAGIIPGVAVMFAGFMGLVLAQIGRAGVDSAEYGQQSLAISREQLEISRAAQRKGRAEDPSYSELKAAKEEIRPTQSYGDDTKSVRADPPVVSEPKAREPKSSTKLEFNQFGFQKLDNVGSQFSYRGRTIEFVDAQYVFEGRRLGDGVAAQRYLNGLKDLSA